MLSSEINLSENYTDIKTIFNNVTIDISYDNDAARPQEIYGFDFKLNDFRNKIDNINNENWKKVRWYINEYDFLVKDPIINRAFYKYWEIINEFEIFENYNENDIILHCAEAPGGFIQGTNIFLQIDRQLKEIKKEKTELDEDGFTIVKRKNNKQKHKIYTISLNKDLPQYRLYNLPSYNKNIINKNVCITYGKDKTGDINNWDNIKHIKQLSKDNFYLVTADGGFDEGTDFNNKEQLHYSLILSEIYSAISCQKNGGHFVLKVFDIFTETSIQLIYLLSCCYENVTIYKPKTSRPTNSEKYIICKNFNIDPIVREIIINKLEDLSKLLNKKKYKYVIFKLFDDLPENFIDKIKNINTQLLDKQSEFLEVAIKLCNDKNFLENYEKKLNESLKNRKEIFNQWQESYNLDSYV